MITQASLTAGRFECPVCAARFPSLGDKKRHLRDSHPKPKNGAS